MSIFAFKKYYFSEEQLQERRRESLTLKQASPDELLNLVGYKAKHKSRL